MAKWLIIYYRPLSGPAFQADVVPANQPIPVYDEMLRAEVLPGNWSPIEASLAELSINRGLRFELNH